MAKCTKGKVGIDFPLLRSRGVSLAYSIAPDVTIGILSRLNFALLHFLMLGLLALLLSFPKSLV